MLLYNDNVQKKYMCNKTVIPISLIIFYVAVSS